MLNKSIAPEDRAESVVLRLRAIVSRFQALELQAQTIEVVADKLILCIKSGRKVIFCGNGGSAADAQHFAAEFMGRYMRDRQPLPSMSLTVDTSALTAIANDYGYEHVFSRQLTGIGQSGDALVGMSTSGNSENVIRAFEVAKKLGIVTVAMTGEDGGKLAQISDFTIRAPSTRVNEIQEMHVVIGHMLCGFVEEAVC